jgi:hypothetical protein
MKLKLMFAVIALYAAVVLVFSPTALAAPASSSVNIFPPNTNPYNLTYADHAKNFWIWNLAIPAEANPIDDATGEKCATGQTNTNSTVFYLAYNNGGVSKRTCEVPAGKALLIPVMQVEKSDKEYPGASIEQLDQSAKKDQDSVNSLYLKIGDKEYSYQDLLKYRVHTEAFDVTFPDKGIFGVLEGGPSKAVADGFYILTEPLKNGTYPIHFKSSLICPDPDCSDPNFVQDITYNIIAK